MKALGAVCVAVFVLWVVDLNFNGSRYTSAVVQLIRPAAASIGIRF
jgi:hypothetical protein